MPSTVKMVVATIVYVVVRSLLASRAAKRFATSVLESGTIRAVYRPFCERSRGRARIPGATNDSSLQSPPNGRSLDAAKVML